MKNAIEYEEEDFEERNKDRKVKKELSSFAYDRDQIKI